MAFAAAGQAASCSADSTPAAAGRPQDSVPAAAGKPNKRLAVGGVRGEYRTAPRAISRLEPPKSGFFSKEIVVRIAEGGAGVPIRAHECVSDGALLVAADRLSRMLRYLPVPVLERLQRRGAALHIIGVDQGCSDLPEHIHMKGVDGGYTKEAGVTLDQRARGMGGTLSSCGEENLVDQDTDPRYAGRDILVHEFGHCVMDVGLPPSLHAAIGDTYRSAVAAGKCTSREKLLYPEGTQTFSARNRDKITTHTPPLSLHAADIYRSAVAAGDGTRKRSLSI